MTDNDFLDSLLTPEEIARRITASSGVKMTARTVWDKARRIGVAKKIGRSMLISIEDVPALLREEKPKRNAYLYDPISAPTIVHQPGDALAALKRARKKRQKTRLEKVK